MSTVALMLESDGPGGAEWMLLHLAEELRRRGHDVVPVGPANGCGWLAGEFRARGFNPEVFNLLRPIDWRCARGLVAMLRACGVDVVHSHEFTMAFYGTVASRILKIPHVITMHGALAFADRLRRRVATRWAFRNSRHVAAVSQHTRTAVAEALGIAAEAMTVIPNGLSFSPGERSRVRAELDVAEDEALLLAVGNLYPVKGHILLLRALAALKSEGLPGWRLAIAGRGAEQEKLLAFARGHGCADRLHLLGYRADIPDLLAACDLFLMPSLSEGLPMAILEAMFAGRAIIASAVGGIPDVISSGRDGILVPAGEVHALSDALRTLLASPQQRETLAASARLRAEADFGVQVMVDRYEALYGISGAPDPRSPSAHRPTICRNDQCGMK